MSLRRPQPSERLLVSQREAARLLSVSVRTLFALRDRGELDCVRMGPRVLYSVTDLRSWIEIRKHGAASHD